MSVVIPAKDITGSKQLHDGSENAKATMVSKLVAILIFIKVVPVHLNESGKEKLNCLAYLVK